MGYGWSSFQKERIQSILCHCSQSASVKLSLFNPRTKWTVFNRAYWGGHSLSSSNTGFFQFLKLLQLSTCHRAFAYGDPTAGMFSCLIIMQIKAQMCSFPGFRLIHILLQVVTVLLLHSTSWFVALISFSKCRHQRKFLFWWLANVYISFSISFLAQRGKGSTFLFWRLGDWGSGGNIIWGPTVVWLVDGFS